MYLICSFVIVRDRWISLPLVGEQVAVSGLYAKPAQTTSLRHDQIISLS